MKILILGARGMLGHDLMTVFKKYHPIGWDIADLDITKPKQVLAKVGRIKPDVIINAAAYTDVDGAEKNKILANKINSQAVGRLARTCLKLNTVFVHFSTDYVFSGHKRGGYQEKDQSAKPINFYGCSKLGGEKEILKLKNRGLRYYLIRTAWLFGPRAHRHQHKNFVDTILHLAATKKEIKVVNDQWGSPTYSWDLAQAVKGIIEKRAPIGIYHITNSGKTNWYKFAKSIISLSKSKLKVYPCNSGDYPSVARRPKYSILLNTKLSHLRSWQSALKNYLKN